jgi:hypothetical protein
MVERFDKLYESWTFIGWKKLWFIEESNYFQQLEFESD